MDTKRMIVGMLLIMTLAMGYQYYLQVVVYPKHPEWAPNYQAPQTNPTTGPSLVSASPVDLTGPQTQAANADWQAIPSTQPAKEMIGSNQLDDPHFHVGLSLVPDGAAIDSVVLNQYFQEVDQPELFNFQNSFIFEDPNTRVTSTTRALETLGVIVDGATNSPVPTAQSAWQLIERSDKSTTYAIDLSAKTGKGTIRVEKQFVISPASNDPATPQGYEVNVKYTVKNLTDKPHTIALQMAGPTVPRAETARQDTDIVAGDNDDGAIKLEDVTLGAVGKGDKAHIFAPAALLWLGESSNYFNAIVHFDKAGELTGAVAEALNPDSAKEDRLVRITMTTKDLTDKPLPPGGIANLNLQVFLGPKARHVLQSQYYSAFPFNYDSTLVMNTGMCGFCTFPWLINFLVMLLAAFHAVLFDWGLAIIALVCVVRLCLHPITKKSQVSMMKMQKLAPEMERLKKKFSDDKEGFAKAQMELYKNVGFTPILGCAPMLFQMPIFIALWRALQTTFELRQSPFLYFFHTHFTWIHDLSQPDFLVKFAQPLPLFIFGWHISGINVLPLAMAVVTFINQKYFTPKPAALTPEQEQQQKMMVWMTLVFPFMFYTFPSGLNLYYLTSTSLGILESKRVRSHIKKIEAEEAGKGPIIVDAGKSSPSGVRREKPKPKAKGFFAKLQERAEEMAREQQRNKKKR